MRASSRSSEAVKSVTPSAPTASRQTSATRSAARSRRPSLGTGADGQTVAQAVHVLDGIVAAGQHQFAAQDVHVAAQGIARRQLVTPYRGFELLTAVYSSWFAHHGLQQADALGRELHILPAELDL